LYRVGELDGPQALYQVQDVFLDEEGGVAVVETSSGQIRFFDPNGLPLRTVGGLGEGPGEFRALWWASFVAGDTLVAFELAFPTSVSIFDPAGAFVRSFRLPNPGSGEPLVIGAWSNGEVVIRRQTTEGTEPGEIFRHQIYSVTPAGSVGTDLGMWPTGVRRDAVEAYSPRASFEVSSERLLYAPGNQFESRQFDRTGTLRMISRVLRPRIAVTQGHIDRYMKEQWDPLVARAVGTPLEERLRQLGEPVFPDSMPAYTALLSNADGGFWARWEANPTDSLGVWDVFDRSGVLIGVIELPARFQAMSLAAEWVAGVTRDANDVEFVEVYEWFMAEP
jgi:hypothetical protein